MYVDEERSVREVAAEAIVHWVSTDVLASRSATIAE